MRKNLLTLTIGLSFLFFGAAVTKAEVSVSSTMVTGNVTAKYVAETNLSSLKTELSSIKTLCVMGTDCDNALGAANVAYALAVVTCNAQGWGSDGCTSAVGVASAAADTAASKCSSSPQTPPQASNTMRKILITSDEIVSKQKADAGV